MFRFEVPALVRRPRLSRFDLDDILRQRLRPRRSAGVGVGVGPMPMRPTDLPNLFFGVKAVGVRDPDDRFERPAR